MNNSYQRQVNTGLSSKRLLLWLVIVSIVMVFGAMTSAFIVRKGDGGWYEYSIPELFNYSTVVIILSSITMHLSVFSLKRNNASQYSIYMWITLALGLAFLGLQYFGWTQLPLDFGGTNSQSSVSFFYVLSGMHWAHIILGIAYIVYALITIKFTEERKDKNVMRIGNCAIFWHFLDALWIYLFVFLLIKH